MVSSPQENVEISKEMEIYKMDGGKFGFDMTIQYHKAEMLGMLQVHCVSNFNASSSIISNFQISMLFLIFLLFIVDAWWISYGLRVLNSKNIPIQFLIQTCSLLGCKHNWNVCEKIHTKKHNKLFFLKSF